MGSLVQSYCHVSLFRFKINRLNQYNKTTGKEIQYTISLLKKYIYIYIAMKYLFLIALNVLWYTNKFFNSVLMFHMCLIRDITYTMSYMFILVPTRHILIKIMHLFTVTVICSRNYRQISQIMKMVRILIQAELYTKSFSFDTFVHSILVSYTYYFEHSSLVAKK